MRGVAAPPQPVLFKGRPGRSPGPGRFLFSFAADLHAYGHLWIEQNPMRCPGLSHHGGARKGIPGPRKTVFLRYLQSDMSAFSKSLLLIRIIDIHVSYAYLKMYCSNMYIKIISLGKKLLERTYTTPVVETYVLCQFCSVCSKDFLQESIKTVPGHLLICTHLGSSSRTRRN